MNFAHDLGSVVSHGRVRSAAALLLALVATMGWWADAASASNSGRMAAGEYNTCLVKADDTIACWSGIGAPASVGAVTEVAVGYAFG